VKLPQVAEKPAEKTAEESKPSSLFGATTKPGGSLFGNLNTVKPPEADPTKKGSLFGGAPVSVDAGQKFGLFGATKPVDGKAEEPKSLFGGSKSTNLFGSGPLPAGTSLFGKPPAGGSLFGAVPSGGGLFSNASQGPSLFAQQSSTAAAFNKSKEDEGDSDDGEEQEGEKSPPIYADSTTKIEFKGAGAQTIQPSPYTKLFEVSFRPHTHASAFVETCGHVQSSQTR